MTEIHVQTSWDDSGYDCDHCGGRILKRTDRETGQQEQVCFQCEVCGCQWSPDGGVLRVGHLRQCAQAQREREASHKNDNVTPAISIALIVGAVVLVIALVLVGGVVAIRFLIPIAIIAFVIYIAFRVGRDRGWW